MPLVELTKQKGKFKWTKVEEQAFQCLKNIIINNPTIHPPNFNEEFFLITDASKVAISGILAQQKGDHLIPIEFFGRKLKESETKYFNVKFELLAIHDAVEYFKNILWGRKFTILTGSKALTYHIYSEK